MYDAVIDEEVEHEKYWVRNSGISVKVNNFAIGNFYRIWKF